MQRHRLPDQAPVADVPGSRPAAPAASTCKAGGAADDAAVSPPLSWPRFEADEIAAVTQVLASGRVNQWTGGRVIAFADAFARHFGADHAIAVFNGTVALELALIALGIGPGDEVIVTSRSFIASASAVSTVGATPVFADVEAASGNISAETVAPLVNGRTRAILPVHLAGWPVDMLAIMALARRHGLLVVEDCAQSHGATIEGRHCGTFGDAAAFSFCQDKIMTTGGEGGMVLFADEAAYRRAWSYKDHGKDFELSRQKGAAPGFRYVHGSIGTNWRMLEMQAAIGLVQLGKLERWTAARTRNAAIWRTALAGLAALDLPEPPAGFAHAYYKLYGYLRPEALKRGADRDAILAALRAEGLPALTGSCPEIYREAAFAAAAVAERPTAHRLGETSLMFEVHPTLDPDALAETARRVAGVVGCYSR
ncbi:MAG: DegT/DnrJ/EryC1/StrS aminotransferase family protein [Hyphomicrobiaceae bacterium]